MILKFMEGGGVIVSIVSVGQRSPPVYSIINGRTDTFLLGRRGLGFRR